MSLDAVTNAAEVNKIIEAVTSSSPPPNKEEDVTPPAAASPPDTSVLLPAGLISLDGSCAREAEVRELNGLDEEEMAKAAGNLQRLMDTILERGVVRVGAGKPTRSDFDRMLSADLETLLVAVSRATFGEDLPELEVTCSHCEHEQVVRLTLSDIPQKTLDDPLSGRQFTLTLPSGKTAMVNLPVGEGQRDLLASGEKNYGALKSLFLSKTVQAINGLPLFGISQVNELGIRDRDAIIEALGERNPGPRLKEVTRSCVECAGEIPLPLTLAFLFRL